MRHIVKITMSNFYPRYVYVVDNILNINKEYSVFA